MTEAELEDPKLLTPMRIYRIARGSGTYPQHVLFMLEEYKRMAKMIGVSSHTLAHMHARFHVLSFL